MFMLPRRSPIFPLLLLAIGVPSVSMAVEWRGSVDASEVYTDNLQLVSGGLKEDAWVTRVKPSVGATIKAKRLELDLDYGLEGLLYANDSDRNGVFSNLSTYAVLGLIGDELWLRGAALIDQVNVSPSKALTSSNINITGNRSDATTWNVGPQWRRSLFNKSELDAYFTAGRVSYDEPAAQDVKTLVGQATIRSSSTGPGDVGYEIKYEFNKLDYEISGDVKVQSLYLQLSYQINETFRLTGLVGADSDFTDPNDSSLSQSRWETGFSRVLGRNEFAFSFGRRFWGNTYFFEWNRRQGDHAQLRMAYSETPSTTDIVALQKVPSGEQDDAFDLPDSGLDRPGTARRFIRKRGDAGVDMAFHKTSFYVGAFWETRDNITLQTDPFSVPDEDAYGVSASLSRELGHKTVFHMSVSHTTRELIVNDPLSSNGITIDNDTLLQGSAGIDYDLGLHTFVSLGARYNDRKGAETGFGNYREFSAQLGLTREF